MEVWYKVMTTGNAVGKVDGKTLEEAVGKTVGRAVGILGKVKKKKGTIKLKSFRSKISQVVRG